MPSQLFLQPGDPLSPSELVLLNGDQFANKVMMGNIQLMHTDASVSISQLAEAMLSAGVLTVEANRGIKFDIRSEKAMLGLRKVKRLYALATYQPNDWPAYSLESQVMEIAEQLDRDGENSKLSDLIYIWLREDSAAPWQSAIKRVQSGLAERSLLEANETTRLKVFTKVDYSLPGSTAEMASQFSIDPVKNMLSETETKRNEVWELVKKEIKQAIKQRTEQDDMDFD